MWMRFPEGTESVSVHQQTFGVEVTDKDGRGFFRIPNHFVPMLLDIRGFDALNPPDGTDIPDLPQPDPARDGAIERLSKQLDGLKIENGALQTELEQTRKERDMAIADVTRLTGAKKDAKG